MEFDGTMHTRTYTYQIVPETISTAVQSSYTATNLSSASDYKLICLFLSGALAVELSCSSE